jgi:hypothetical protein
VDARVEQEVQQPNMVRQGWVQSIVVLQRDEEILPLCAKSTGNIVPKPLNVGVVYAPSTIDAVKYYLMHRSKVSLPPPDI